jgi:hypothetical protein
MFQYEWRVSAIDGMQSLRLSAQGIWLGNQILPWDQLRAIGFERYHARGRTNEILTLKFADETVRRLRWYGHGGQREAWRAMVVALANECARRRPDLHVDDGPDARAQRNARWTGLAVAGIGLSVMGGVFASGPPWPGWLAGAWIGVVGVIVGASVYGHYARRGPPPTMTLEAFATREAQPGDLPAN